MKAIEAAARAIMRVAPLLSSVADQQMVCEYEDLCRAEARAAIRAYLTALAEDDAAVERVARAIADAGPSGGSGTKIDVCVWNFVEAKPLARAAIDAIGKE